MDKIYYKEQTRNAIDNFGKGSLPLELIKAYAEVKKACITAIQEYEKKFDDKIFKAIINALDDLMENKYENKYNEQFPLSLLQGGAGTSINMNINEVIDTIASNYLSKDNTAADIDPIEDINLYQSTNDTFPTAVTIIVYRKLIELEKLVILLQEKLIKKETEFSNIIITGRTEMQDALPITLGQVFASWAGAIERDRWRINKLKERIRTIPLGGTAIGTCFFAPREYVYLAEKNLRKITGLPLTRSQNLTDEIANLDKFSEAANCIKLIAENLYKISADLLIYTSGFVKEIEHPNLQYGSTIMPAKTNPVILEFVHGLAIDIKHECCKISEYSQSGQLQLNPYLPFVLNSFLNVFNNIEKAVVAFIEKFLDKMKINTDKIEKNFLNSKAVFNSLIPFLGYNKVKELFLNLDTDKIKSLEDLKNYIVKNTDKTKEETEEYLTPIFLAGHYKGNKK